MDMSHEKQTSRTCSPVKAIKFAKTICNTMDYAIKAIKFAKQICNTMDYDIKFGKKNCNTIDCDLTSPNERRTGTPDI